MERRELSKESGLTEETKNDQKQKEGNNKKNKVRD